MPAVCSQGNTSAFSPGHTQIRCCNAVASAAARISPCRPCIVIRKAQRQHLQQQQHLTHTPPLQQRRAPGSQKRQGVACASNGAAADVSGDSGDSRAPHRNVLISITPIIWAHSLAATVAASDSITAVGDISCGNTEPHVLLCSNPTGGSSWLTSVVLPLALVLLVCNMDRICLSVAILPMAQEFGWPATVQVVASSACTSHSAQ